MRLIIEGMAVQPSSKKIKHSRKRHYSNWKYCPLYPPVHLFSGILNIFEFSLNSNCYTSITINADFLSEGFHFKTVLWKELIPRQYVRKERWSLIFNHLEIYRRKLGIRWVGWAPCWNDLALQEQPFFKTTSKKSSIPVLPQHLIALEEPSSFPLHFFSCSDTL